MKYLKLFEEFNIGYEITIEVLDKFQLELILNEKFYYDYYDISNQPRKKLSNEDIEKLDLMEEEVENYLKTLNPFEGDYLGKSIEFEIETTKHWYTKFLRKYYEDPQNVRGILTPDLLEGIKLIHRNANYITYQISKGYLKNEDVLLIKTIDRSKYSVILSLDKISENKFVLKLVTQMKGLEFYHKHTKKLLMHPNGTYIK